MSRKMEWEDENDVVEVLSDRSRSSSLVDEDTQKQQWANTYIIDREDEEELQPIYKSGYSDVVRTGALQQKENEKQQIMQKNLKYIKNYLRFNTKYTEEEHMRVINKYHNKIQYLNPKILETVTGLKTPKGQHITMVRYFRFLEKLKNELK